MESFSVCSVISVFSVLSLLLLPRRSRRTFLPRLAEFHDPDPRIDVVEKDVVAELASAPGEGHVRSEALRVACPQPRDLAPLGVKVSAQLARYIQRAPAAAVIAHHQNVVFDPDVVRSTFGNG